MGTESKVAELLLKAGAIVLRPQQPFKFASGILSPIYCDNRLLLSKPAERKIIRDFYVKKIKKEVIEADVIAGIATASIPWAALVAEKLKKPMIYIRKEAKDHGRENLIEGGLEPGQKVLVIEDLVSTGGTSLASVAAARKEGAVVENCVAIFSYEMEAAVKGFIFAKCNLLTLSNFSVLVEVAAEKDYIKPEDIEVLKGWSKNPAQWGKKMGFEQ
ncbi:orotate phosphoribosyltransferase [Candidatus Woesearchaeota archaeon]|nr:orotate phosphoribosyltransferase [Candidatus Woesearchaeota archaeon]